MTRRLAALRQRHAALDLEIEREQSRRSPDAMKLRELKLRKLRVKDALAADWRHEQVTCEDYVT